MIYLLLQRRLKKIIEKNSKVVNKKIKIAILISGRGSNMQALVKACDSAEFPAEVVLVLSNKSDAEGLKFAEGKGFKTAIVSHKDFILAPEDKEKSRENFDKKVSEEVEKSGAQIICLAGFMRLLSPWFVQRWFDRLINIHPSLLPEFKGADAVGDAIKAGAKKSGCTVHFVREEMDSGPIIKQVQVKVFKDYTKETLAAKILKQEHKIYSQALKEVCEKIQNCN
jgi:phosphoribosylglycinamide formyltransferase-1